MTSRPLLTDVRFVPALPADVEAGLLGFVSCVLDGAWALDGLALRRSLDGRLCISFPERRDSAGRRHPYIRPLGVAARQAAEGAVIRALESQGNLEGISR